MSIMRQCGHITSRLHACFKLGALVLAALSALAIATPVWAQEIEWSRQFGTTSLSQFDGTWSGETSQAKEVSFMVEGNAIPTVAWGMVFPGCGAATVHFTETFDPPVPVGANSFSIASSGPEVSYTLAGTFASDTSASGSREATYNLCNSRDTVSWSATKTLTPGSNVGH